MTSERQHLPRRSRTSWLGSTPGLLSATALAASALFGAGSVRAQSGEAVQAIEVIGTAPMPGLGVPRERLPYGAATVRRSELEQRQAETLGDHLTRQLPGMQQNDIQGSPYQGDITLRGFRASALLGAAQGVAVYLDGVRINEPFGDVVLWDLVPEFALNSVTVVPGANPAFGLNALGGSIALQTQDGRTAPGVRALASGGSFGRGRVEMGLGQRHGEGWHSLVAASHFNEDGWRDFSPGRNTQLLAKLGHDAGRWAIGATFLGGRSTLVGNGLVPAFEIDGGVFEENLYGEERPAVVYTHPDRSHHQLGHTALHGELDLGGGMRAQALVYLRRTQRDTINGDAADELDPAEPDINASLNTTRTRQRAHGLAASVGGKAGPAGRHQWQLGLNFDRASVKFEQQEQEASFDATRGARAGGEEPETSVRVAGRTTQWGVYGTDTWSLGDSTHLTGTLRANHARVANTLETLDELAGVLVAKPRESFTYRSLNPALGVVQGLGAGLAVFGNVARNTRVPTVIELGCADPAEPCRLPAGLQSDPYLKQVRSTSLELGLRWSPSASQRIEALAFRTDNRDDIVFGSVSTTGSLGYFRNFPRTRHQGLELQWSGRGGPAGVMTGLEWGVSFARLDATYQATDTLRQGERNVEVTPGTPIAGLPRNQVKLALDWRFAPAWSVGLDAQGVGSRRVQGNEDRRLEDGGAADTTLKVAGYGLLNLRAAWRPARGMEVFAAVRNALDRRHETYAALAETVFDEAGVYTGVEEDALFVAPGAPRSVQVGVRLRW